MVDRITVGAGVPLTIRYAQLIDQRLFGGQMRISSGLRGGLTSRAKEMPGYDHLASFIDDSRIYISRLFVAAEFKVGLNRYSVDEVS